MPCGAVLKTGLGFETGQGTGFKKIGLVSVSGSQSLGPEPKGIGL